MKNLKLLLVITVFSFAFSACLKDDPIKIPFQTYTPIDMSDGWEIAKPDEVNINGKALEEVYKWLHEDKKIWQIKSLLVFKDNKLVAESYMRDQNDRTNLNNIWSNTKQVVGIISGIAIDNHYIESLNDPISKYLPQTLNTNKSQITIENLLTMRSGINHNNWTGLFSETATLLQQKPDNSLDYILGLDMRAEPGTEFWYNDGNPQIISAIIQKQTGKTMRDWAKDVLFDKVGFKRYEWIVYKDGITMGAFGIRTTPRELAKIGQLVINDGQWNGEQLVSRNWLREMTSVKVSPENDADFGYFWWIDKDRDIVYMDGSGGQMLFINKSKKLIIVITSEQNTQGKFQMFESLEIYDRINRITN